MTKSIDPPYSLLKVDEFVRSVTVNKKTPHGLFLGAGASVTSGVPSAGACIWDWKRQIFLTNNPGLEDHFREITLGSVRKRLQLWLDSQRCWPTDGDDQEYGTYIESCYRLSSDRTRYFQELSSHAKPFVGYRFLSLLAQTALFKIVWTTNFDGLTVKAVSDSPLNIIECGLDTSGRALRSPHANEFLHVSLHGDYRYDSLKNTPAELQTQDTTLRDDLVQRLYDTHLVVCGYSGRDKSVMDALFRAYNQPGPGRLFWCGLADHQPCQAVRDLLALAQKNGREAFYVECDGFDDVMRRLALSCLEGEAANQARQINETQPHKLEVPAFQLEMGENSEVLRSNAFSLECPSSIWHFPAKNLPDWEERWKFVQQLTDNQEEHQVLAAPFKEEIFALGDIASIKEVFHRHIAGEIKAGIVTQKDLAMSNGFIVRLFTSAIVRSLAQTHHFQTDGRALLWEKTPSESRKALDTSCRVHKAVLLAVRRHAGEQYVVLKPTIIGFALNGETLPKDVDKELKRQMLSAQHNKEYVQALNLWRARLFYTDDPFYFPPDNTNGTEFKVSDRNVLAIVHHLPQGPHDPPQVEMSIDPRLSRLVKNHGVRVLEPQLIFLAKNGQTKIYEANPLRGIAQNRPYDYALTQRHLNDVIRIGVVAPNQTEDAQNLSRFLQAFQFPAQPGYNKDYVLPFGGFKSAFGVDLVIPKPGEAGWSPYAIPDDTNDLLADANRLRQNITTAIARLKNAEDINAIMIYVPNCCEDIIRVQSAGINFDLRRMVKAFCIEKGIASQFLLDKTIFGDSKMLCQSLWWLSLALYVKANRTPWILSGHDEETAFAGLGFSVEHGGGTGKHITIGCSHIYNSRGIDLKYKLSGLENVVWRHKNPFLDRDDARRIGEGIRELFFEATNKLPRRVVLHKRTPFSDEEKKGLLEGLQGVEAVDLLEITEEPHLRYMTNRMDNQGQLKSAPYPVNRDTVLQLDSHRALLWVHGTMPSVQGNRQYYMGGYSIPSPLVVRRAYGETPLVILAHEILGLSKMNWNTFSPYTKAPATIQSSNDIASIGSLLTRFGSTSYDYRLFI